MNRYAKYKWRIIDRNKIKVQFQFDPTGFWIGALWKYNAVYKDIYFQHIMISVIPLFPLHITIARKVK